MMRAIRVSDGRKLIPVFTQHRGVRLCENATTEVVELIRCTLFDEHMRHLAVGIAMRVPEDAPDEVRGTRIALGRALADLEYLYRFNKHDRLKVMNVLNELARKAGQS